MLSRRTNFMNEANMAVFQQCLVCGIGVLLTFLSVVRAYAPMTEEDVRHKFEESGIVPELLTVAPKHAMDVLYKNQTVKFGNNFTRGDFDTQPTNLQWPTLPRRFYTVIFTDPDCPKRSCPIDREWQHWIVVNVPGCDYLKGEVLTAYIGGLPYYLQYPHRYVFLAYMQPEEGPAIFDEPRLDSRPIEQERYHFSTNEFVEKYNLGVPVAGNFFMAGGPEPPEEIPEILRRLITTTARVKKSATTTTTAKPK